MIPIAYNIRSLTVRKTTAVATVLGVALVALVFSATLMLAAGVERTLAEHGRDDVAVVLRKGSDSELASSVDDPAAAVVRAMPGAKRSAAELVTVVALNKTGAPGISNVTLRGVAEDSYPLRKDLKLRSGRMPSPGTDEAIVGQRVAGRFRGLEEGGSFELRPNRKVNVVGTFEDAGSSAESEVWLDRDVLRAAFGRAGSSSSLRVELATPGDLEPLRAAVEHDKRLGLTVESERAFLQRQSQGLGLFIKVLGTIIAVLFSIGTAIGAAMTMHGSIAHRRREIGTLRALGFSRSSILIGFLLEATALTAAGGVLGATASLALGAVHVSMVNYATWSELVFGFVATPKTVLESIAFAVAIGVAGGLVPAIRAASLTPLSALRSA